MRKTSKGRRKLEEDEFCLRCNGLRHAEEIERLKAALRELAELARRSLGEDE